jgi:RNA polymerase sigma-70 factor (ECF subfamily)
MLAPNSVEPSLSDGELARRIGTGALDERQAEASLCRRLAPRIRLYALRHLRDSGAANDLVQEVLVVMLEALRARRIEDLDRIDRFVLGTCRNLVLKEHRTARRGESAKNKLEALGESYLAEPPTVDRGKLTICVGNLPSREQRVLLLSFRDEESAEQIARELGTTPGNIRVIRHRALASLQRCLGGGEK